MGPFMKGPCECILWAHPSTYAWARRSSRVPAEEHFGTYQAVALGPFNVQRRTTKYSENWPEDRRRAGGKGFGGIEGARVPYETLCAHTAFICLVQVGNVQTFPNNWSSALVLTRHRFLLASSLQTQCSAFIPSLQIPPPAFSPPL